jgi:glucuronoarabinoxylan endo-1,4-beta-xylanase
MAVALLAARIPAMAQASTIDWTDVYQRIDGFGASCAFSGQVWSDADADMFFSTTSGIGLSLLRNRIQPDGTASASEIGLMQMAQARGALVWSAPWSPPASFKDNNSVDAGNFVSANFQAYADQLAGYVATMKETYGVNIYAVSVQNEPNFAATYESCIWTAQQIHDFVPFLSGSLSSHNVGSTRILLPEDVHWESDTERYMTALNDPAVAPAIGIIADHNYDGPDTTVGSTAVPSSIPHAGKALWETEVMTTDAFDGGIANAMYWAQRIHLFLTAAQVNAWHYWWLTPYSNDNEALEGMGGVTTKRMYVLGQYSRFVRPGYYRIGVANGGPGLVSAYKDPVSGNFAIVAVNNSASAITIAFNLSHFTASSVTPWVTSDSLSLAAQPAIPVANSAFTSTLAANSVVTFVGTAAPTPTPPSSSQIVNFSIRSDAGTGSATLIAGLAITGGGKSVLVRAAGPTLAEFGITGALADTQLGLYSGTSTLLASNSGWGSAANSAQIASSSAGLGAFAFPAESLDSAFLATLGDGSYSCEVTGVNGSTGVALAEIYDADPGNGGRLVNVSARTHVGTGASILIAGFVISGTDPKTVLVRGVGPSLALFQVGGVIPDPQLSVFNQAGTVISSNTGWGSTGLNASLVVAASAQVGAFPLINDSADSALVVTLPPGLYTAQLKSVSGASGNGLIEVYDLH